MLHCAEVQHALQIGTAQTPMPEDVVLDPIQSPVVAFTSAWATDCFSYLGREGRACSWDRDDESGTGKKHAASGCQNQTHRQDSQ
jgi:hypothetical protein